MKWGADISTELEYGQATISSETREMYKPYFRALYYLKTGLKRAPPIPITDNYRQPHFRMSLFLFSQCEIL